LYKKILISGAVVYAALFILSLFFYEERTAFLDIAYHLFYIIKDGDFAIQNNRFGSCFTQFFPLIASKVNVDLQNIMKLYSIAFVILYASVFFIIMLGAKSYQFGLVMLLHSILMVTDTFFWIQSELPQGLAFLLLFFSFIIHKKGFTTSIFYIPFVTIGILTLVFFHPLMLFPFLFIVAFFYGYDNNTRKPILKSLVVTFLGLLILKQVFFKAAYDSTAIGGLKNFVHHFPNYITLQSNKNFIEYVFTDYQVIWLTFFEIYTCHYQFLSLFLLYLIYCQLFQQNIYCQFCAWLLESGSSKSV